MAFRDIVFVLLFLFVVSDGQKRLQWENCDSSAPVLVANLTVLPYPISLEQGVKLRIKAAINLKYTVKLKIEKKFMSWYPTIPCIRQMGSCDYKIGLQKLPTQTIDIPDIDVPAFITNGKYRVQADVREDKTDNRLFCLKAAFEIDT